MYRIVINNQYRSLLPSDYDFPNFVVLTGVNGSGKTQFLEAINNTQLTDVYENDAKLHALNLFSINSLSPSETESSTEILNNQVEMLWQAYNKAKGPYPGIQKPNPIPSFEVRLGKRNLKKVRAIAS